MAYRTLPFLFFFAILLVTTKVSAEGLQNVSKLETPGDQHTPTLPTDKIYGDQKQWGPLIGRIGGRIGSAGLRKGGEAAAKQLAKDAGEEVGKSFFDAIVSGDYIGHSP